jgi:hypothetical protein
MAFTYHRADLVKLGVLLTKSDNLCKLWHKIFGTLKYGSLPLLNNMVVGFAHFKVEKTRVCIGCALNKHAKVAFSK